MTMIKCYGCSALYQRSSRWVRGYPAKGTTGEFIATSRIDVDVCPLCGTHESKQPELKRRKDLVLTPM